MQNSNSINDFQILHYFILFNHTIHPHFTIKFFLIQNHQHFYHSLMFPSISIQIYNGANFHKYSFYIDTELS